MPVKAQSKSPLSPAWVDLFARLSGRRAHIGLSRLARFASARGLAPKEINDEVVGDLIAAVREQSLCPRPTVLHRQVTQIWNEAARDPALGLRPVTVPSYRAPKRIDWARLPKAFRRDGMNIWPGAASVILLRPMLVHAPWRRDQCGCAAIRSMPPSRPWWNPG